MPARRTRKRPTSFNRSRLHVIQVRPLRSSDVAQVLRINAASRPAVAELDRPEIARLLALPNQHLVALNGESRIVAYALAFSRDAAYDGEEFLVFRSAISEPFVYVDQVAVLQEARGSGVGRALYEELQHAAAQQGAYVLCCEINVTPPNPESMAFHTKMGFEIVGTLAARDGRSVELRRKLLLR